MRTVLVFIPILLLLLTPCVIGSVSFTFDREIILPDSFGSSGYSFDDLNGDGYDEVVVDNENLTAVYSIQDGQVVDYFRTVELCVCNAHTGNEEKVLYREKDKKRDIVLKKEQIELYI